MDKKTKDIVFSLFLAAFGVFVVAEGMRMVNRASKPPYNIELFRVSPGMLPVVLGLALLFFTALMLINTLRQGPGGPGDSLGAHLAIAGKRVLAALREADTISMIAASVIMFAYTFFLLGEVPFWIGAVAFLVILMSYLRAAKLPKILLVSGVSVAFIILLFQIFFKTTLP